MRLVPVRGPSRPFLRWIRRALFASAALLLGYCAFSVGDAWLFQWRESRHLALLLKNHAAASGAAPRESSSSAPLLAPAIAADGLIGRIEIPRLLLSAVVVEGVDKTTLRRAVGHIPGTALPGQPGNVGLAGHRDSFFRPLKDVRLKDEIQLSTLRGNFTYEVVSQTVVAPTDVGVLAPTRENVLTMVTCYPFYYVGPAPKRFVVTARQVIK